MTEKKPKTDRNRVDGSSHQKNSTETTATPSRRRLLHLLGAGGVVGLAGCSASPGDGANTPTEPSADTPTETSQFQQSATIALSTNLTTEIWGVYGGVTSYYLRALEPLVWATKDMQPEPWLAESWEATGEKTWEFTLRKGVSFHNGKPLNADAVVFSFSAYLDEWDWGPGWLDLEPDGVRKIDDMTVEFTTADPFPNFPRSLAHGAKPVQHPDRDRSKKEVIGTGPFKIEEFSDQEVRSVAFEDYWNGTPQISELHFRNIQDANTRSLALRDHAVDVAFSPPTNQVESLNESDDTEVVKQEAPGAGFAGINIHNSPTDDVKLRKGFNYAVSQELIVENVLNGVGLPARGPIGKAIHWSNHENLPEYGPDKNKAQEMIDQSSYNGETLLFITGTSEFERRLATVVQHSLNNVGVDVKIQAQEGSTIDVMRKGKAHLIFLERSTNSAAADYLMDQFFHSQGMYNMKTEGVFSPGRKVDSLIEKGQQSEDPEVKKQAFGEALQIIMEKAVVIPLYYKEYVVGKFNDIKGLDLHPIETLSRWSDLKHLKT